LVAAYRKHHDAVRALLRLGANPNARDLQRFDTLTIAAVNNDIELLKIALEAGADARAIAGNYDGTALIAASHLGHVEIVKALIAAKAPLDHVNSMGWTALIMCVVLGNGSKEHIATAVGQQVIVDNRPGAGSTLAAKAAATAEPDGYTLLVGSAATLAIGPMLYPNAGYDPTKSFAPIAFVSSVPYVMIARPQSPAKTVPDLIAYAKANPGKLNFGIPNGAPPHMLAAWFRSVTATDIVIVPYRGASTVITDMIGGQIDLGFETTSVTFGHVHEGKVRALGVATAARLTKLPDVPTMIESGVPDFIASSWTGIV